MSRSLYVRGTKVEDGRAHELVIVDGVVAGAAPLPSREPDAVGWVVPGLADVHNHLSLASPACAHEEPVIRVRASASVELAVGVLAIRKPGGRTTDRELACHATGPDMIASFRCRVRRRVGLGHGGAAGRAGGRVAGQGIARAG